jgi:plasmid maintenance system killer protein
MRNENAVMSNSTLNKTVLLEFIEAVLAEEGENPLYNTFIQPFVDVGTTTAYGIEKLSAQVQTVVMGFLLGLPTLFRPFLEYDYESFREEERERVEEIKKKYEKVFKANLDAISSNDAFGVAFLLAPTKVLAAQLAVKAPYAAIKALDVLTGAAAPPLARLGRSLSEPASIGFHDPGGHSLGSWSSGGGGGDYDGGGIYEASQNASNLSSKVQNLLKDKKIRDLIQKSPVAKQMQKDGVALLVNHIKRFMAAKDYNQMRQMAKGDVGFSQIGQKLADLNKTGQIPVQNNSTITAAMVPALKKVYKEFWIKQLQTLVRQYPEANDELLNGIKQVQAMN